jgi:hypothetical protein
MPLAETAAVVILGQPMTVSLEIQGPTPDFSTSRKQGMNLLESIKAAFAANPVSFSS